MEYEYLTPGSNYPKDTGLKLDIVPIGPRYVFEPQPDITAYELACCMKYMFSHFTRELADEPESVRRHWREIK